MIAMKTLYLVVPLAPLAGAIVAGLFGRAIGRAGAHWVTILAVAISFAASCAILADVMARPQLQRYRLYLARLAATRASRSAS